MQSTTYWDIPWIFRTRTIIQKVEKNIPPFNHLFAYLLLPNMVYRYIKEMSRQMSVSFAPKCFPDDGGGMN